MLLFLAGFFIVLAYGVIPSRKKISKLQLIQKFAGRIILAIKIFDRVSAVRKSLGWLSVRQNFY